jgi:NADP-dependent 3-hydroxy acid dehydrogenase YdfG
MQATFTVKTVLVTGANRGLASAAKEFERQNAAMVPTEPAAA